MRIPFVLENIFQGNQTLPTDQNLVEEVVINPVFDLVFSDEVAITSVDQGLQLFDSQNNAIQLSFSFFNENRTVRVSPTQALSPGSTYQLQIGILLESSNGTALSEPVNLNFRTIQEAIKINTVEIGGLVGNSFNFIKDVPLDSEIRISFSAPINPGQFEQRLRVNGKQTLRYSVSYEANESIAILKFPTPLDHLSKFELTIQAGNYGQNDAPAPALNQVFYTEVRTDNVFPLLSDEALLTRIQERTFKYFWDYGHPVSGLSRERFPGGNLVTIGGSGFGIMAMIVAVERGFITRSEAVERWETITSFLAKADRFHGVWPHWMDGTTGAVIPFSVRDNGGDLVETAFMAQGLLTVRQYLDATIPQEKAIIDRINQLWSEIEWTWYTKDNEKQLYWHWSPDMGFAINLRIRGHNETQVAYILGASSPTFPIDKATYDQGYANNGQMQNGRNYYGLDLPLGPNLGGPLFFSHYSHLGLDPRNLQDPYANYWEQGIRHSTINQRYCADNPKGYVGYSQNAWGLTASDGNEGYSAHSPTNDRGVITPTAAISSIPFTPELSMSAIRHFYYQLGDRLWGEYGFYDAYNPTEEWVASSYLAIDQGPIICMIENHRTQLLWDLFMSAPEIQSGLRNLGFTF